MHDLSLRLGFPCEDHVLEVFGGNVNEVLPDGIKTSHSNPILQEDLIFWSMICNVLDIENEYPSGKDSAFSLSPVRSWSLGSSV